MKAHQSKTVVALFDVDGTLYTAHMWRGLMTYAAAHGRGLAVRAYYVALAPLLPLNLLHLIGDEQFRALWVLWMGWPLRGWSVAQGDAAFQWIADEFIRPTARADMVACLGDHVAAGHTVLLVSAMLAPVLARIGGPLGVAGTIGTEIELQAGRYTGRVIGPACLGVHKEQRARRFLEERGLDVDWAASYAYADSISDVPLLEMVGHPVAVSPDAKLAAVAQNRQWRIR